MFFFKKKKNTASLEATTVEKKGRPCLPTTRLLSERSLSKSSVEKTIVNAHDVSIPLHSSSTFPIERTLVPHPCQLTSSWANNSSAAPQEEEEEKMKKFMVEDGSKSKKEAAATEAKHGEECDSTDNTKTITVEDHPVDVTAAKVNKTGVNKEEKNTFVRVESVTALLLPVEQTPPTNQLDHASSGGHSKASSMTSSGSGIPRRRHIPAAIIITSTTSAVSASAKDPLINKKLGRFSATATSLLPIPKAQAQQKKQFTSETSRQCRSGPAYSTRLPVRRAT